MLNALSLQDHSTGADPGLWYEVYPGSQCWTGRPALFLDRDGVVVEDTQYLGQVRSEFQAAGIPAEAELAYGDPAREIINWVQQKGCDLVAMSTHGHRFLADIFLGTTASHVQHNVSIPVLLLRAK